MLAAGFPVAVSSTWLVKGLPDMLTLQKTDGIVCKQCCQILIFDWKIGSTPPTHTYTKEFFFLQQK